MQATNIQAKAVRYGLKHPKCLIPLPVGEGKTLVGLLLIGKIEEPAVVFSTRAIIEETWGPEIEKWGLGYTYAACTRSKANRRAAIESKPMILGVSFDHLKWYFEEGHDLVERTTCIIDETSKVKTPPRHSQRTAALVKHTKRFSHCYGLSATPAPEGAMGLWAQFACITPERPLGILGNFRTQYFDDVGKDFPKYVLKPGALQGMAEALRGRYFPAPPKKAARFGLPAPREIEITIPWGDPTAEEDYKEMQKEMVIEVGEKELLEAGSPGVLQNKLRQMASGFIYDAQRKALPIGETYEDKRIALGNFIDRLGDVPLLVFTQFEEECEQIREVFPEAEFGLGETTKDRWNDREIPLLVLHPKSAAHGINLQGGSNMILFYSLPWSGEEYDQSVGRLYRRGQTQQVTVARLVREGTIEERIYRRICEKRELEYEIMETLSGR